ncbi:MAG: PD-(D/E)XK nuclease family protein [Deltaproteobacteria bacterium]|nr:PD-(D/E)XK nuclease family protein [Deltaproteobacteria bacterium]
MSSLPARVWPSGQALEQAFSLSAVSASGGLLLGGGGHYTFQGKNALLPLLWSQLPSQARQARPLAELAGPVLVQKLLENLGEKQMVLSGISRGRRFPHRLWRLLVGLKAARLEPEDIASLPGPGGERRKALASMLAAYTGELSRKGLVDEADQLAAVEAHLLAGGNFPSLQNCPAVQVQDALWLRPADLRLIFALSHALPVRVCFALTPVVGASQEVFHLLEATARALETHGGNLEVEWNDLEEEGGPLAGLALEVWDGGDGEPTASGAALDLVRAPGRYAEVEELIARARELVDQGTPPHEIILVFPELSLYGQMASDVAARLGLPIAFRRSEPLSGTPYVQAILELLSLPQAGYPRVELAMVWGSPYLGAALSRHLQVPQPDDAGRCLNQAFYVDAQETPIREWLNRAADKTEGHKARALRDLASACGALTTWLAPLDQAQSLAEFCRRVESLLKALRPTAELMNTLHAGRWASLALARDLNAWEGLTRAVRGLAQAAEQVGADMPLSPGRLLALLGQALEQQDAGAGLGARGGVRVLRLEDAQGLRPAYVLAGGLNLEEFPSRPADLHLLDSSERLDLGKKAGLPVWRTEEEEYGGQVLRLLLLLGSARKGAVLSCCAADLDGSPRNPSLILIRIAQRLGREDELKAPRGSVFGDVPPVGECRDARSLWSALARDLLRPSFGDAPTDGAAPAVLFAMVKEPGAAGAWEALAGRSRVEEHRLRLEALPPEARLQQGGPFDGLLLGPEAREFLTALLAEPARRTLSPSALEGYVACPMQWFLARVLGLAELREPGWDLERSQEGTWVHETLARFFAPKEFSSSWDRDAQIDRLELCLAQAMEKVPGHGLVQQARQAVLAHTLATVVAREMQDMGSLRPGQVEAEFGGKDPKVPPLEVPLADSASLLLTGRLDRLDQGPGTLRVVDYKHASLKDRITGPLKEGELGVSAFQMPVYLAAARELWGKADDALSARVVPTRKMEHQPEQRDFAPGDPLLAADLAARQELAAGSGVNLFNSIAELWARVEQGQFLPLPEQGPCDFCQMGGVCRARINAAAALNGEAL